METDRRDKTVIKRQKQIKDVRTDRNTKIDENRSNRYKQTT